MFGFHTPQPCTSEVQRNMWNLTTQKSSIKEQNLNFSIKCSCVQAFKLINDIQIKANAQYILKDSTIKAYEFILSRQ